MESWSELLRTVLAVPGTDHACVVDPAGGGIVAEAGGTAVPGLAGVLGWGAAQVVTGAPGPVFEDAVIATREGHHHLLRALPRDGAAPLLAYAHLDRSGGPVALVRRALRPARTPRPRTDPQLTALGTAPGAAPTAPPAPTPVAAGRPVMRTRPATPAAAPPGPPPGPPHDPPAPVAVPSPSPVPDAERTPPADVPLPRRGTDPTGAADRPEVAPRDDEHAGVLPEGGRWADDLGTMARILAALRRWERPPATEC